MKCTIIVLFFVAITVIVAVPIAHPDGEEETKPTDHEDDLTGVEVDWDPYLTGDEQNEDAGSGEHLSLEDTIRNSMDKVSSNIRDRIQAIPFAI
uniref:Putative secreted protein n=1 Tax=Anopheles triannulatus TaxID=58253 RepID=A0A2M3ZY65_9DIPT